MQYTKLWRSMKSSMEACGECRAMISQWKRGSQLISYQNTLKIQVAYGTPSEQDHKERRRETRK